MTEGLLEQLKDGDRVWLVADCAATHRFWTADMRQDCVVELVGYNGRAFNVRGSAGLYPVELIDIERTARLRATSIGEQ